MSNCDLCGRRNTKLVEAIVEGTMLSVCENCTKFGNVIKIEQPKVENKTIQKIFIEEEKIEIVDLDYSSKIKKARENLNLKQEELAKKIAEKASTIQKLESGHLEPSISLAKKLEKNLNIKLIIEHKEKKEKKGINFRDENLTIGDLLKTKNE